ncbi:MAG: hypothetical protein GY807_01385, partial [Gammaproteobacteria bacterium]|nr:hypothetical protein [Gammaproteobacteria bacterium]
MKNSTSSITAILGRGVGLPVMVAALILSGCDSADNSIPATIVPNKGGQFTVTVTAAADFTSGAHSVINVDAPRMAQNNLVPTTSDLSLACEGRFIYRIERFMRDNVTKFDVEQPEKVIYQYSANDASDAVSSNPSAMVFVDETKAYLLRYGSSKAWIVNPSAGSQTEFKIGELDLSAYDEGDGSPEMQDAVIVDDRLYIVLQRLSIFEPTETAYVAVFNTRTDIEIDTGQGETDGLKGIALEVRNPLAIEYLPDNGLIYVQAVGRFAFGAQPAGFNGGIESIDPEGFETRMVLDDGNDLSPSEYGQISNMALVSANQGYFIGTAGFLDNTLYRFDPSTGAVQSNVNGAIAIGGLFNQNL